MGASGGIHSPLLGGTSYRSTGGLFSDLYRGGWSVTKRPTVIFPLGVFLLFCGLVLTRSKATHEPGGTLANLHETIDKFTQSALLHGAGLHPFGSRVNLGPEWACNPHEAKGRLIVDVANPRKGGWRPYDAECKASTYMSALYRSPGDTLPLIPVETSGVKKHRGMGGREFLPWMMNRTVVIHGDSIDRYHLKDFCTLLQGHLFLVSPDHAASPDPFREPRVAKLGTDGMITKESLDEQKTRAKKEAKWESRPKEGYELTNPWVCDVAEYGFTLVNVFTWGLEGAEEFFETERWYYPPARWVDRLHHITIPLLQNLARTLNRPQIEHPDLVEMNSGFWDLRKYTEEDFTGAGWTARPYPEDSPIPYTNLSPARELRWEAEARKAIKEIAREFKGKDGVTRNGPTLLWRTLHHPHRHNYAPYPRVFALDNLSQKVVSDLQREYAHGERSLPRKIDIAGENGIDLGLDERLRMDYSGHLLEGQEMHFRDLLHPNALPGSWLWAEVMLYELKRAVKRIGRTSMDSTSVLD